MRAGDYERSGPVEIWPENKAPLDLYLAICTQWRVGPGGLVGLDHTVVHHRLDRMNLTPRQYDDLLAAMGIVERAALKVLNEKG